MSLVLWVAPLSLWLAAAQPSPPAPPDPLAPVVRHPAAVKVVEAFRRNRYSQTASLANAALGESKLTAAERAGLRFLRALARERAGLRPDPADWMAAMNDPALPGLGSHAAWYLGKRLWDQGLGQSERKAFDLAGPYLERVGFPGRFGLEARGRLVRGLWAAGARQEACQLATRAAEAVYRRYGEAQAIHNLAACRERTGWVLMRAGDPKSARAELVKAAQLYKMVAGLWPDRWAGPLADKAMRRLAKAGHKPGRLPPGPLLDRARDIVERPMGLRDLRRLWRVRTLLPWSLKDPAGAEVELLWAELSTRFRRFKRAWNSASRVKRMAPTAELKARAALVLGRLTARRRSLPAVDTYLDLAKRWPQTAAAAPAVYQAAEILRRRGQVQRADALFGRCVKEYDGRPAANLCRWGLAWAAFRAGESEAALGWLEPLTRRDNLFVDAPPLVELYEDEQEAQADEMEEIEAAAEAGPESAEPVDEFEGLDLAGLRLKQRARYWHARIQANLGRKEPAVAAWRRLVDEHPFSYYAVMAFERLAQQGAAPELAGGSADPGPAPMEALHPEVAAAVAYYRLGLEREARTTLMTLRRGDLEHAVDRRWAALLRERAGDFSRSHRLAPVPRDGGLPDYPEDGWRVDARLAYPRAFAEQVEGPARAEGIPQGLLYALIRAESGFWVEARSPANARGLTQVITPTAWAMARKLKIRRFRHWRLYEPEMSVRVGSAYLAMLLARYRHPVPAIAAYNAGEPSVDRWIKERGQLQVDAFIEEIPYAETARYTRKLVAWWAIYRVLYGQGVRRPLALRFAFDDGAVTADKRPPRPRR